MLDSREVELEAWSKVKTSRELMMHGVVRSMDGGDSFNIMIFWADPVIRCKFPGLALVFNMVYGAVSHEATSESTFSGAGRAFNKARTLVGSTTLRDSIVVSSGEKRHAATAAEVCAAYRDRRKGRSLDVDDESASSSFPAYPAVAFPVGADTAGL